MLDERQRTDWVWRHRWKLLMAWIVIFTALVFLGLRQNRIQAAQGADAHDAICVLKTDLRNRISDDVISLESLREFINNNPKGAFGLPKSSLELSYTQRQTALKNERSTLRSLSRVKC